MKESSKKKFNKRRLFINGSVVLTCLVALSLAIFFANRSDPKQYNENYYIDYELVRVTQVLYDNYTVDEDSEHALRGSQSLNVVVLTGEYKGDVMMVTNYLGPMHEKLAEAGTVLTVTITTDVREDSYQISIVNYDYTWLLVGMVALFVAAVVVVGRRKGAMSLLGLAFTLIAIVFVLLPLWFKGYPAVPLTLCVCIFVEALCFTLLGGITKKTVSAMMGAALGVLVAGGFAAVCGGIAGVSGMTMSEAEWLLGESQALPGVTLNVRGLFVAGILISSLGAVMDVAMSISSAVTELHEVNPQLTCGQLFKSGMNIGRDMIGTMTNTLILAFAGSSLNLMLIMFAAGMQPYQLMNNDDIIMEAIRAIGGSVGLVLAVPLTALVSSVLISKKLNSEEELGE